MKTKKLVTSAMLLAFALILSFIQILNLPFGGSITLLSMLPIVFISYIYGSLWGVFCAFIYALLQMLVGMGTISAFFLPGDSQMAFFSAIMICVIDYIFAYSVLGLGGIFKGKFKSRFSEIALGAFFATFLRYIMHIISGYIFFGAWAEWFFGASDGLGQINSLKGFSSYILNTFSGDGLSLVYSVIYNGAYMIPEIILTTLFAPVIYKIIKKSNPEL